MAFDMVKWIQLVHGMDQLRTVLLQEVIPLSVSWQSLSGSVVRPSDVNNAISTILYDLSGSFTISMSELQSWCQSVTLSRRSM